MLSSLARYLEPLPDDEGDPFLTQIQTLFQTQFVAKQPADREEGGASNTLPGPMDSDYFSFDQPINGEGMQEADSGRSFADHSDWDTEPTSQTTKSETDNSPVLHLGSVLLTGHDYLL